MQGVWHWAKGSLFPGQGVRQRSPAWEGGREGGEAARLGPRAADKGSDRSPPASLRHLCGDTHLGRPQPGILGGCPPPAPGPCTLRPAPRGLGRARRASSWVSRSVGPGPRARAGGGGAAAAASKPGPCPARPHGPAHTAPPTTWLRPSPASRKSFLPPRRPAPYL